MTAELVAWSPGVGLSISEAVSLQQLVHEAQRDMLVKDEDYGKIAGIDRPILLQPGAEKLLQLFGLGFTFDRVDVEVNEGQRSGVTYRCTVFRPMGTERIVIASCDGYAGYDEDRFFSTVADRQRREDTNAKRYDRAAKKITGGDWRAPWHNVLMMAQKRALVGATRHATASSGLFTQDLEDQNGNGSERPKVHRWEAGTRSGRSSKPKKEAPAQEPDPSLIEQNELQGLVVGLLRQLTDEQRDMVRYLGEQDSMPKTVGKMSAQQCRRVVELINQVLGDGEPVPHEEKGGASTPQEVDRTTLAAGVAPAGADTDPAGDANPDALEGGEPFE